MSKCCPKKKKNIPNLIQTDNKRVIETNKLVHEESVIVTEDDNILMKKVCCGEDFIISDFSNTVTGRRHAG